MTLRCADRGRLFGTDGVRGLANRDLTAELALDLSVAAAHVLADAGAFAGHRPLGRRRPRRAGPRASSSRRPSSPGWPAPASTCCDVGRAADARRRLPDRRRCGADLGVMLSASHNPMPDNGIKFFARGGRQARRRGRGRDRGAHGRAVAAPDRRGRRSGPPARRRPASATSTHLLATLAAPARRAARRRRLRQRRASAPRREALRRAGAEVVAIHAEPDGLNINDGCGSHPPGRRCGPPCVEHGADAGIAHDGDADRCLAVDADRRASSTATRSSRSSRWRCATHGRLADDTVVATVMTNLGFAHGDEREARHHVVRDRGRRPLRARGDARRAGYRSAASSPATS